MGLDGERIEEGVVAVGQSTTLVNSQTKLYYSE